MAYDNKEKSLARRTFRSSRLMRDSRSWAAFIVMVLLLGVPLHRSFSFYATVFVTNTNDSGAGSLRQAMLDANAAPGTTIAFNIPTSDANFNPITGTFTIRPTSALPSITADGTVLDGTTQTAATGDTNTAGPEIVLDGGVAGANVDGLNITASNCVVKGLTIQGFSRDGVRISSATATGDRVQGCYIGTNYAGTAAAANGGNGVYILGGAANNIIGGATAAERNVISGNGGSGVRIEGTGTINNIVQGNNIGTNAAGTAGIPNGRHGVNVLVGPNAIGAPGVGNRIAFNDSAGVSVIGGTTSGVRIRGNAIFSNNGLGIDLGINGVTTNDVRDLDVGPNGFQNFPVLNQVLTSGGNTVIRGTFSRLPNTTFTLDFYSSAVKDPSNFGEGETYIGSANVATDGFGDATINVSLAEDLTGRFVTATATNLTTGDTSEFSAAQQATAAPATPIAFSVQPSNTVAGSLITPAVAVSLLDEFGNVVTSATNAVTLAIGANPGGGVLSGTVTKSAVSGTATFNDLSINRTGNGYTLIASSVGFTSVTSAAFNITPGPPSRLAFTVPPSNTQANAAITPAVQVAVQDSFGNLVNTATNSVTVAIGANPSGGTLSGTTTLNAVNGVATFSNLSIEKAGNGYMLRATSPNLTDATSAAFNILPASPSKLVFVQQPTSTTAGKFITPPVKVAVQDRFDNVTSNVVNSITLDLGVNPGGASLGGIKVINTVNGIATFNDLNLDKVGTGYRLRASTSGLPDRLSDPFDITVGNASVVVFTQQPTDVAGGNPITSATNAVTISLGSNPGTVTLSVEATDNVQVQSVWAEVTKPDNTKETVNLTRQSGSTYTGTFNAPANNTKKDITYRITVSLNNGTPITAGTVTVAKKGRKPQSVLGNDEEDTLKISDASPLRLRLLSAHNGSGATVFTFTLNRAAAVTARVLSPTGKAVRQFGLRQAAAGLNSLLWDGKAQTGGSVARGVYLIEILVQDETGQVARAAQTVVVK